MRNDLFSEGQLVIYHNKGRDEFTEDDLEAVYRYQSGVQGYRGGAVMANKQKTTASALTNFDAWKQTLTPEFIAQHKFIVLSCGACPAYGKTCNRYDTTCRGTFLNWVKGKYEEEARHEE